MEEFHILVNTSRRSFEPVLSTSSQLYLFLDKDKLELDFLGLALNNFHQQAENFGAVEVYGVLAAHLLHYGILLSSQVKNDSSDKKKKKPSNNDDSLPWKVGTQACFIDDTLLFEFEYSYQLVMIDQS